MSSNNSARNPTYARLSQRVHTIESISVNYEGRTEELASRPPDVSRQGMFISTVRIFPEGAVLNLRFRLALSGAQINTRCEVRYCLPGVGVGVEFIGISPDAVRDIEREVNLCNRPSHRVKTAKKK
jgi:PilZ domain-containing protein